MKRKFLVEKMTRNNNSDFLYYLLEETEGGLF